MRFRNSALMLALRWSGNALRRRRLLLKGRWHHAEGRHEVGGPQSRSIEPHLTVAELGLGERAITASVNQHAFVQIATNEMLVISGHCFAIEGFPLDHFH